jgi:hypothetical protein
VKFKQILIVLSILFNAYFLIELVLFNSQDSQLEINPVTTSQGDVSEIEPSVYFTEKYFDKVDLKKIEKDQLIDTPLKINQIVNYAYNWQSDTNQVGKYFANQVFPKLIENKLPNKYDFNSLNELINLAISYKEAALYLPNNEIIFNSISEIIFDGVSKKITSFQKSDLSLSNRLDFQILVNKCIENNFYPDLKESSSDKFLKTLLEKDYFHLLNTSYQKSNWGLKCAFLVALSLMLYGLFSVFKLIKNNV